MTVYIQTDEKGEYHNINAFLAAAGFEALGFEVIKYQDIEAVQSVDRATTFVGGIGMIRKRLEQLGIYTPYEIEYPASLRTFLRRKVWTSTLHKVMQSGQFGIFIKPVQTKLFKGKVIERFGDFIGLKYEEEVDVWCSEVIPVVTEWRCFVRYGVLIDVRYYRGKWDSRLDLSVVESAIAAYTNQPSAYCLDFGVDAEGEHYLIEVNDGHSLGSYGMEPIAYAKFLSARWSELVGVEDVLNF